MVPSIASPRSARAGATPTNTDPELRLSELLNLIWREKVSVKSNYARTNAEIVAMAASLQLITTKTGVSTFASAWQITTRGLTWLHEKEHD